jgi:transposase InsO family protein
VSLTRACTLLGITRQAIYQREQRNRRRQVDLRPVKTMVLDIRRLMPRLGGRKLYYLLKPQLVAAGIKLGRDGLFSYLRAAKLLVPPKRSYTKTTYSKHWMRKHPNLLPQLKINRPEQVFVSDITYLESDEGIHYLSLITDACSRKIMGYELSHEMKASDTVKALARAVKQRLNKLPLIHHSDRGAQYCSSLYQQVLKQHDIRPSMTDGYDCYQNALAERINGILKQEFFLYRCKTFKDLKALVAESIAIYNHVRPHLSLGMQTPESVHKKASSMTEPAS